MIPLCLDSGLTASVHRRGAPALRGWASRQRRRVEEESRRSSSGAGAAERERKSSGGSEERVPAGSCHIKSQKKQEMLDLKGWNQLFWLQAVLEMSQRQQQGAEVEPPVGPNGDLQQQAHKPEGDALSDIMCIFMVFRLNGFNKVNLICCRGQSPSWSPEQPACRTTTEPTHTHLKHRYVTA